MATQHISQHSIIITIPSPIFYNINTDDSMRCGDHQYHGNNYTNTCSNNIGSETLSLLFIKYCITQHRSQQDKTGEVPLPSPALHLRRGHGSFLQSHQRIYPAPTRISHQLIPHQGSPPPITYTQAEVKAFIPSLVIIKLLSLTRQGAPLQQITPSYTTQHYRTHDG